MNELIAPAKLTLSLFITGLRPDGLHTLEAEMVTIDFADTITIEEGDTNVSYVGQYPITPSREEDLIVKALQLVEKNRKKNKSINVKSINNLLHYVN